MNLRFNQLENQFKKGWLPAWLVSGDEPFQQGEACQLIRNKAREMGFDERKTFNTDTGIDWSDILNAAQSMGLFGGRTLIEIRLGNKRPDKTGSKILQDILANPSEDIAVLISCSKLDRRKDMGSKWVTAIDQCGALIEVWPVDANQLPQWINQRLQSRNLKADDDALALLSERSEGNLLACAQEIDKLSLLFEGQSISALQVQQAVGDSSRHSVFDLTDALQQGPERTLYILEGLRAEGTEPAVILWALARETRMLDALAAGQRQGIRLPQQKMAALEHQARKLGAKQIAQGLILASKADKTIKGMAAGEIWSLLIALALLLSGSALDNTLQQA